MDVDFDYDTEEDQDYECMGEGCSSTEVTFIPEVWNGQAIWDPFCKGCAPKPLGSVRDMPVVEAPGPKA